MEKLKQWALLALFISAGSLIYCFLLPSGSVSKTVKSVVSLISLSLICLPLFGIREFFQNPLFPETGDAEIKSYESYVKNAAEEKIRALIDSTVKKYTDVPYKTEIFIDIKEDNCINIEYVSIVFSALPTGLGEIKEALYNALGIVPFIKAGESNAD